MATPRVADDLHLALRLADAADALTLRSFRRHDLAIETKPDFTPVSEADIDVERQLRALLGVERPLDSIVGEEFGGGASTGRRWILDPIDGTKNFVRGVPVWATLIALAVDDSCVVGVVSAPALGRRWWGAHGLGAYTRGPEDSVDRALHVSAIRNIADASLSVSDPVGWPVGALQRLQDAVWHSRAYGDFWSHLLVAEGAVDIAAEPALSLWDMAALVAIVEEAGGRITTFDGADVLGGTGALTTNALLHDAAMMLVSDASG